MDVAGSNMHRVFARFSIEFRVYSRGTRAAYANIGERAILSAFIPRNKERKKGREMERKREIRAGFASVAE